ncbi:hypothetical protein P692DRAFT_20118181 [Suillus brevipes Sb2]|nr:hypothetical protein P692DRAFT_20118181 [Suillus brevipes Sb2]
MSGQNDSAQIIIANLCQRPALILKVFPTNLLNCLNELPEFTDEAVNTSMRAFECDLK